MFKKALFQVHWFLGITAGVMLAVVGVTGAMLMFRVEIMTALSPRIVTVAPSASARFSVPEIAEFAARARPKDRLKALEVDSRPDRAAMATFDGHHGGKYTYIDPYTGRLLGDAIGHGFFDGVENLHRYFFAQPARAGDTGRQITKITALCLIFFALSGLYLRWPRRPLDWRSWLKLDLRMTGHNLYRALHAIIGGWLLMLYMFSAITGLWWSFGDDLAYSPYRNVAMRVLAGHPYIARERNGKYADGQPGVHEEEKFIERTASRDLRLAWSRFQAVAPQVDPVLASGFDQLLIETEKSATASVRFRARPKGASHSRAYDDIQIDGSTGRVLSSYKYSDSSFGDLLVANMAAIHEGTYFHMPGRVVLFVSSLTMPLFTITGFLLYFERRRKKRALRTLETGQAGEPVLAGDGSLLVVYASQTRTAERLGRQTAIAFSSTGYPVDVVSVDALEPAALAKAKTALFIASTYGEGEPPDSARGFARRQLKAPIELGSLSYAVLALGDREYPQFCAFGRRVDQWLQASGARRLFDTVEVNGEESAAFEAWRKGIATLGAASEAVKMDVVVYERWRLAERKLLNHGSLGLPAFHVALEPVEDLTPWEAGDIAEILPGRAPQGPASVEAVVATRPRRNAPRTEKKLSVGEAVRELLSPESQSPGLSALQVALEPAGGFTQWEAGDIGKVSPGAPQGHVPVTEPLPPREYSIASTPAMGRIEFIVRQVQKEDGQLGLGSGWLTERAAVGEEIRLRLRANPAFRAPDDESRAVILIGNGTGLAGLLAHIRQRAGRKAAPMWLLFGERSRAHDRFHAEELDRHLAAGTLTRMDCAFSRDPGDGRYVQDIVAAAAEEIRRWIGDGAAIYVCGSLKGMAPAVDRCLREILGDPRLDELTDAGLYRRDIY